MGKGKKGFPKTRVPNLGDRRWEMGDGVGHEKNGWQECTHDSSENERSRLSVGQQAVIASSGSPSILDIYRLHMVLNEQNTFSH
jgi:hypothetical protein